MHPLMLLIPHLRWLCPQMLAGDLWQRLDCRACVQPADRMRPACVALLLLDLFVGIL